MFLVNSRLGHFTAALFSSSREGCHLKEHPFSRSYGAILPSSLTRVFSIALVSSTHLPVSVWGTGTRLLPRGFSWQCGINHFASIGSSSHLGVKQGRIYLSLPPTCLNVVNQRHDDLPSCVTPLIKHNLVVPEYLPVVHRLRLSASA